MRNTIAKDPSLTATYLQCVYLQRCHELCALHQAPTGCIIKAGMWSITQGRVMRHRPAGRGIVTIWPPGRYRLLLGLLIIRSKLLLLLLLQALTAVYGDQQV